MAAMDPVPVRRLDRWLWAEFGDLPGAWLVIALWTAVGVSLINLVAQLPLWLIQFFDTYIETYGVETSPPAPDYLSPLLLPLTLGIAGLHCLVERQSARLSRSLLSTAIVAVFLFCGAWLWAEDFLPGAVRWLGRVAWPVLTVLVSFGLALTSRRRPSPMWAAFLIGSICGVAAVISLAYPAYTLAYSLLINPAVYTGLHHYALLILWGVVGSILFLAAGPLALYWSRVPRQLRQKTGILSGGIAGLVLFGGLGSGVAGLVNQSRLLGLAFDRTGYSQGEWMLHVARAGNASAPIIYAAMAVLLGLGALSGLVMVYRYRHAGSQLRIVTPHLPWPLVGLLASLLLPIALVNLAAFYLYGPLLNRVWPVYGDEPFWQTYWNLLLIGGLPWLLYLGLQMTILGQFRHRVTPQPAVEGLLFFNGIMNVFVLPLLSIGLLSFDPIALIGIWFLLPIGLLIFPGIEMLAVGWTPPPEGSRPSPRRIAWGRAGLWGILLSALLIYPPLAIVVNLGIVALVFSDESLRVSAQPPGPLWLDQTLAPLFALQFALFVSSLLLLAVIGLGLTALLRLISYGWQTWVRHLGYWGGLGCVTMLALGAAAALATLPWWFDRLPGRNPITAEVFLYLLMISLALILCQRPGLFVGLLVLLAVAGGLLDWGLADAALHHRLGQSGVKALALSGGIFLTLSPRVSSCLLRVQGWGLLIVPFITGFEPIWLVPFALAALAALIGRQPFLARYLYWPNLILALAMVLAGLLGLTVDRIFYQLIDPSGWFYLALLVVTGGISYQALRMYAPPRLAVITLPAIMLLIWLMSLSQQTDFIGQGGVSRYDPVNGRWTRLDTTNSPFGDTVPVYYFNDNQSRFWAISPTGLLIQPAGDRLGSDLLLDIEQGYQARRGLGDPVWLLEDTDQYLWIVTSQAVIRTKATRRPANVEVLAGRLPLQAESSETVPLWAHITAAAPDARGHLCIGTGGQGVHCIEPRHRVWQAYTHTDGLPSDIITAMEFGPDRRLWVATTLGLAQFDGEQWQPVSLPPEMADETITTLLADEQGSLWAGTAAALYHRTETQWAGFTEESWPASTGPILLHQDRQGSLWAGTPDGLLRFDGSTWQMVLPGLPVSVIKSGEGSQLWLGGSAGAAVYNTETGALTRFTADDGSLAANHVRDIYPDREGRVWVSTYATTLTETGIGWPEKLYLTLGVMLALFVHRGYVQAHQVRPEPDEPSADPGDDSALPS